MFRLLLLVAVVLGLGETSHAQWGSGAYFGNPQCPYGYGGAAGARDESDDIFAAKQDLKSAQKESKRPRKKWIWRAKTSRKFSAPSVRFLPTTAISTRTWTRTPCPRFAKRIPTSHRRTRTKLLKFRLRVALLFPAHRKRNAALGP